METDNKIIKSVAMLIEAFESQFGLDCRHCYRRYCRVRRHKVTALYSCCSIYSYVLGKVISTQDLVVCFSNKNKSKKHVTIHVYKNNYPNGSPVVPYIINGITYYFCICSPQTDTVYSPEEFLELFGWIEKDVVNSFKLLTIAVMNE